MTSWQVWVITVLAFCLAGLGLLVLVDRIQPRAGTRPCDLRAEIGAVAEEALAEAPELADDTEAVARAVGMCTHLGDDGMALRGEHLDIEGLRSLAAADAAAASFRTPEHLDVDIFLTRLFRTRKPEERP